MLDCTIDELILLLGLNHPRALRAQLAHSFEYVDFTLLTVFLDSIDDHIDDYDSASSANASTFKKKGVNYNHRF